MMTMMIFMMMTLMMIDQDDCISVGDDSEHMLFERINASGIGLVCTVSSSSSLYMIIISIDITVIDIIVIGNHICYYQHHALPDYQC